MRYVVITLFPSTFHTSKNHTQWDMWFDCICSYIVAICLSFHSIKKKKSGNNHSFQRFKICGECSMTLVNSHIIWRDNFNKKSPPPLNGIHKYGQQYLWTIQSIQIITIIGCRKRKQTLESSQCIGIAWQTVLFNYFHLIFVRWRSFLIWWAQLKIECVCIWNFSFPFRKGKISVQMPLNQVVKQYRRIIMMTKNCISFHHHHRHHRQHNIMMTSI